MQAGSIAIIPGAREILRNGDSHYRFRQQSDFYYLTGFEEPDALLILIALKKPISILFNRSRDLVIEQWTGRRLGQDDAKKQLLVDEAYPINSVIERLTELMADTSFIYYQSGQQKYWDHLVIDAWQQIKQQGRKGIKAPEGILDIAPLISEMRLFKSDAEIALMKQAAAHSSHYKGAILPYG
jgi:Xaa-Pro aminopeptidase